MSIAKKKKNPWCIILNEIVLTKFYVFRDSQVFFIDVPKLYIGILKNYMEKQCRTKYSGNLIAFAIVDRKNKYFPSGDFQRGAQLVFWSYFKNAVHIP